MTEQQPHPDNPAPDAPAPRPDSPRADLVWNPPEQLRDLLEWTASNPEEPGR